MIFINVFPPFSSSCEKNSRNYIYLIGGKIRQYEQNVVQNGQLPQGLKKNFFPHLNHYIRNFLLEKKSTNYFSL